MAKPKRSSMSVRDFGVRNIPPEMIGRIFRDSVARGVKAAFARRDLRMALLREELRRHLRG